MSSEANVNQQSAARISSVPGPRSYVMRWVDVPSLEIHMSEQVYEPMGEGLVRFRAGTFTADIQFDEAGLVVDYPGIATRL